MSMPRVLNFPKPGGKKILFLGYSENETAIVQTLINYGCQVFHTSGCFEPKEYDLVVSYGYKHIISEDILEKLICPIINLHISYLPFNRGAHPNFWSFFDRTPTGLSIHLVDKGIDTGPTIFQKKVEFETEKTFEQTYFKLRREMESLFQENLDNILNHNWVPIKHKAKGTYHRKNELPKTFAGWDSDITSEILRLKSEGF